jgi:carboxypeptidase C (cathepsin A)
MVLADCPDRPSRVTSLPNWRQGDVFPCMYSGALQVNATANHNLFYWLFKNPALANPSLVLWLNGGPGSSSTFGLFVENGPLRVVRNSPAVGDLTIGLAPEGSWVDQADVVFLDQPVGTGFSYGDSYVGNMQQISDETLQFLVQFVFT